MMVITTVSVLFGPMRDSDLEPREYRSSVLLQCGGRGDCIVRPVPSLCGIILCQIKCPSCSAFEARQVQSEAFILTLASPGRPPTTVKITGLNEFVALNPRSRVDDLLEPVLTMYGDGEPLLLVLPLPCLFSYQKQFSLVFHKWFLEPVSQLYWLTGHGTSDKLSAFPNGLNMPGSRGSIWG